MTIIFLHQKFYFFYTKNFNFFTPTILIFLHQKFCFLHQILKKNGVKSWCKKCGVKKVDPPPNTSLRFDHILEPKFDLTHLCWWDTERVHRAC